MLRYHVTVINDPLFFVLISRTVSWLGVRVGQIRQNVSLPFSAPLIPSTIHAHLCLFVPGGRQWKSLEISSMNIAYIFQHSSNISTLQGRFDQMIRRGVSTKGGKKAAAPMRSGGRVCQKSLAEFAARRRQIKCNPFFAAACTSQKTLLSLQVWNLFAFSEQIMRAADCKPFFKKGPRPFLTS